MGLSLTVNEFEQSEWSILPIDIALVGHHHPVKGGNCNGRIDNHARGTG
jgi:hypothetical protein